jgi:hypothetical protein
MSSTDQPLQHTNSSTLPTAASPQSILTEYTNNQTHIPWSRLLGSGRSVPDELTAAQWDVCGCSWPPGSCPESRKSELTHKVGLNVSAVYCGLISFKLVTQRESPPPLRVRMGTSIQPAPASSVSWRVTHTHTQSPSRASPHPLRNSWKCRLVSR